MLCYLTDCVETITRLDVNFFFPTGLRLSRPCTSARGGKVYRESTLRPHGRLKYAILKKNCTVLFTVINAAISEDMMIVNVSLESSIAEVKGTNCTSPWNLSERCVIIFVEILPAFNHSDLAMQMKIPY